MPTVRKVKKMMRMDANVFKLFNQLGGELVLTKVDESYIGLPILGPYFYPADQDCLKRTYTGQYKNGKRTGFGTMARIIDFKQFLRKRSANLCIILLSLL